MGVGVGVGVGVALVIGVVEGVGEDVVSGKTMTMENGCAPVPPMESVKLNIPANVPAVVGVPLRRPVAAAIDNPGGSPEAEKVYGGTPAFAITVKLYPERSLVHGLPGAPDMNEGLALIGKDIASEPVPPMESVTVNITGKFPVEVGMPLMIPVAAAMDRPGGSPEAEKEYGGVPEFAFTVKLYPLRFWSQAGGVPVVTAGLPVMMMEND